MKAALVFILWLLCLPLFYYGQKQCCGDVADDTVAAVANSESSDTTEKVKKLGPLLFNWTSGDPVTSEGWDAEKKSILSKLKDNQTLQITGLYADGENSPSGFDNMGLARASNVKSLLGLDDERVELKSRKVSASQLSKEDLFEAARFDYLIKTEKIIEETVVSEETNTVSKKTTIYFPYNSTNKLNDAEVETYLNDLINQVKSGASKISLTGHTDSYGDDQSNMNLGMARANVIKNYLISKGFPSNRVIVATQGERQPVANNDTKQGRQKNRRTELTIVK